MKIVEGGVTKAKGFEAASTAAKIKYEGRTDMALVYSEIPCVAAGTFTTNVVKAAPVRWDRQLVDSGRPVQAVVVNSGIANACTGEEGMYYCEETAKAAAAALGIPADSVALGSTGEIGRQLPIDRIRAGVEALARKKDGTIENGTLAAKAIMTTDTTEKELAAQIEVNGKTVTIGGMAKGSGMIHPNMCTMPFEKGIPKSLNGKEMKLSEIITELNSLGGKHGIGIIDIVENRVVGMKSRGVYETPGGTILMEAHQQLEELVLDRATHEVKKNLANKLAQVVYEGKWFTPLREAIQAFVTSTQEYVTGEVKFKLYKGNIIKAGTTSPYSLYSESLASFTTGDLYDHHDADGFINLFGLPLKVRAMKLMEEKHNQK